MHKKRVLFICIHNSARSQMAAAFLKSLAGDRFEVESAGIEPGRLNPFHYVISVCDEASAKRCPIFPGVTKRLSWSFGDPSSFVGTEAQRLEQTIRVRDEIRDRVRQWIKEEKTAPTFGRR